MSSIQKWSHDFPSFSREPLASALHALAPLMALAAKRGKDRNLRQNHFAGENRENLSSL